MAMLLTPNGQWQQNLYDVIEATFKNFWRVIKNRTIQLSYSYSPINFIFMVALGVGEWNLKIIHSRKETFGKDASLICNDNYTFRTTNNCSSDSASLLPSGGKKREEKGSIGMKVISSCSSIPWIPFGTDHKQ